jgi:plastocyanin
MKKIIVSLVVLVLVGLATYYFVFNNNSSVVSNTYAPSTNTQSTTNVDTQSQKQSVVNIDIKGFAFNPSSIDIKVGTKVIWTNNDNVPHTVTSDSGTTLNSPTLSPGETFSFTFENIGTYNYHCNIHKMMKGVVNVTN